MGMVHEWAAHDLNHTVQAERAIMQPLFAAGREQIFRSVRRISIPECRHGAAAAEMHVIDTCIENNVLEELLKLLKLGADRRKRLSRPEPGSRASATYTAGRCWARRCRPAYQTVPRSAGPTACMPIFSGRAMSAGRSFTMSTAFGTARASPRAGSWPSRTAKQIDIGGLVRIDEPSSTSRPRRPSVPGPEGLAPSWSWRTGSPRPIPAPIPRGFLCRRPIEVRPVNPMNPFAPEKREPVRYNWVKAIDKMPDDPAIHQYLLPPLRPITAWW